MCLNIFHPSLFIGYVNEVSPQRVCIYFPAAWLLSQFRVRGDVFPGANVGEYVLIEGACYGFLAKIVSVRIPDAERKALSEYVINDKESQFHPLADAELLLSFKIADISVVENTATRFPEIGTRVYAASSQMVQKILLSSNQRHSVDKEPSVALGGLISNGVPCVLSLNALFGRHCAIVGTTGSGKSHTISKILDALISNVKNKVILLDPTGEYSSFDRNEVVESCVLGQTCHFPYEQLKVTDLFHLLRPTAQAQQPILAQAIRSLKTVALAEKLHDDAIISYLDGKKYLCKAGKEKKPIHAFQYNHMHEIEDGYCSFDINQLIFQIKEECVYESLGNNTTHWGNSDNKMNDFQTSLKLRIQELLSSPDFNAMFKFKSDQSKESTPIDVLVNKFFEDENKRVLRLDFSQTSSAFLAREIVANAIAKFLYIQAKEKKFLSKPIVLILDEAHLFVNKRLLDADQNAIPLDAFDLIAKECRKFGLFLCLSTQMPRDIPVGTLSQMGIFIVHRLINEQDRRTVEMASSSASKTSLGYLPSLGPGEALITGVDFVMPLLLKVAVPSCRPNSATPRLTASEQ